MSAVQTALFQGPGRLSEKLEFVFFVNSLVFQIPDE